MLKKTFLILSLFIVAACTSTGMFSFSYSGLEPVSKGFNWDHYKIGEPYRIGGKWYHPRINDGYEEKGKASWYGKKFHGRLTANGEEFDRFGITAAHKTLPMPSVVKVTNLENGKYIHVRVNDRGPFVNDRIIDLSEQAAKLLGFKEQGVADVKVEFDKKATRQLFYEIEEEDHMYDSYQIVEAKGDSVIKEISRTIKDNPAEYKYYKKHVKTADEEKAESLDVPEGVYVIQVGAFSVLKNANNVEHTLENTAPVMIENALIGGKEIFRVKLGPFEDIDEADNILSEVAKLGFEDAIIMAN